MVTGLWERKQHFIWAQETNVLSEQPLIWSHRSSEYKELYEYKLNRTGSFSSSDTVSGPYDVTKHGPDPARLLGTCLVT